jgi:hypothetical protein
VSLGSPLVGASAVLVGEELWSRHTLFTKVGGVLQLGVRFVTPVILAAIAFAVGSVLLASAATPSLGQRLVFLSDFPARRSD